MPDGGLNERYSEEYTLPLAKVLIYIQYVHTVWHYISVM